MPSPLCMMIVALLVIMCGKASAQNCYTSSSDCFGGGTDTALTTYESCCEPLRIDNTVRRSFQPANGYCYECIMIGLEQSTYTLNENTTVYMHRLRLLAPAAGALIFARPRLRLNGIPGTASVNDFSIVRSDILLRDSVTGIDVAITISVDGIAGEPPETFTITSRPPAVSSPNDPLFLFRNTTVTITDTDKPTYQFTDGDYTGSEDIGRPVVVTVRQTVSSVQDIHLLLVPLTYSEYAVRAAQDSTLAHIDVFHANRPDAAEHDTRRDFYKTVRHVFFPASSPAEAEKLISFAIFDDAIDEEQEGFIIVLYRDTNLTSIEVAFTPHLRTTLGRINDNDYFFFGFVLNEVAYDEVADEGLQEVQYSPAPGNKTEKSFDFSLNLISLSGSFVFGASGDISFGPGVIRPIFRFRADDLPEDRFVTFNVIHDNLVEGQEIGQLQIAYSTSFNGFKPLFQNVRIIVNDANMLAIGFENISISVSEGAMFAELPVAVLGITTLGGEVTVNFSTIDLTAIAGSDYNSTVMELRFNAAVSRHVVRVPIIQDSITEIDERFRARLTLVQNNGINIQVAPDLAEVTILIDNAPAQNLCFTSTDNCFTGVTDQTLRTYEACCQPLIIDSTVRRSFVTDGRCHECISIGLEQPTYTFNESNIVYTSRLKLLAPAGYTRFETTRIRLNGILGTASENDFFLVTSDILLKNPVTGIDVAITIFVDGIAGEPPETFTITSRPPGVISPNDPLFLFRNTTVTIIDADKPTYQFTNGDYTGSEDTGRPVVVTVRQTVSSVQDIHLLLHC